MASQVKDLALSFAPSSPAAAPFSSSLVFRHTWAALRQISTSCSFPYLFVINHQYLDYLLSYHFCQAIAFAVSNSRRTHQDCPRRTLQSYPYWLFFGPRILDCLSWPRKRLCLSIAAASFWQLRQRDRNAERARPLSPVLWLGPPINSASLPRSLAALRTSSHRSNPLVNCHLPDSASWISSNSCVICSSAKCHCQCRCTWTSAGQGCANYLCVIFQSPPYSTQTNAYTLASSLFHSQQIQASSSASESDLPPDAKWKQPYSVDWSVFGSRWTRAPESASVSGRRTWTIAAGGLDSIPWGWILPGPALRRRWTVLLRFVFYGASFESEKCHGCLWGRRPCHAWWGRFFAEF